MDKDSFWQEITDMAKQHKQRSHSVEQLPEEQMQQLESNVYAHIDQLFSDSKIMDIDATSDAAKLDVITTADLPQKGSSEQRNSLWTRLFKVSHTPFFAMATVVLLSVGVLAYLLSDNRVSESLYGIPASVVAADVDSYIQTPQDSSRAFSGTLPSQRRSAFLAGVVQADLDLIGDSEKPAAHQAALWYHQATTSTPAVDVPSALKTLRSSVTRYSADEQTSFWLKQGYAVEVVHLAAKRAMADLNANPLKDALQFYREHALMPEPENTEPKTSELKNTGDDIARQYIHNHEKLLLAAPAELPAPEQVQEIVDLTHDMKVLIQ